MAPRRRGLSRALTTLLVVVLLSSSRPLSGAAAASPTPSPSAAPAPAPAPRHHQATSATRPGAPPPAKRHHKGAHVPRAAPKQGKSPGSWWRGLNLGQRVGIALAAVAGAMQVAFAAILAARARQLRQAARTWERESPGRASIGGL